MQYINETANFLGSRWEIPQGLGLRQPSAAFTLPGMRLKSFGGLAHSRTLAHYSFAQSH
jgi:hypothetical protein